MVQGAGGNDGIDLSPSERADIDGMYLRLASGNYYEVLNVRRDSDRREIRDAYFALSQRFHPDAYFGRVLGGYQARTEEIFREVTRAYETLSHRTRRGEYDATLPPDTSAPRAPAPPPPPPAAPAPAIPYAPPSVAMNPASAPLAGPPRVPVFATPSQPISSPGVTPISAVMTAQQQRQSIAPTSSTARPSAPPPPVMSQDAARAAAREALARKLGGGGSRSMPAVNSAPNVAIRPPSTPETTAASLEQLRKEKLVREHLDRVESIQRTADEAEAKQDWSSANNALQLLLGMVNNEAIRARADHVARKLFEIQSVQIAADAKLFERNGQYDKAYPLYLKVIAGRPDDVELLVRAAFTMLKANKELPKAAEFARRAVQLAPRNVEAQVTLAQVFMVGGLKASALAALETAAKLDPTAQAVKDLQAKLKG